jgi:hypothetical protein
MSGIISKYFKPARGQFDRVIECGDYISNGFIAIRKEFAGSMCKPFYSAYLEKKDAGETSCIESGKIEQLIPEQLIEGKLTNRIVLDYALAKVEIVAKPEEGWELKVYLDARYAGIFENYTPLVSPVDSDTKPVVYKSGDVIVGIVMPIKVEN